MKLNRKSKIKESRWCILARKIGYKRFGALRSIRLKIDKNVYYAKKEDLIVNSIVNDKVDSRQQWEKLIHRHNDLVFRESINEEFNPPAMLGRTV